MLPINILFFISFVITLHPISCHRFCTYTLIDDIYAAECSYRGKTEIPSDINPDAEIIILSHNNIEEINNDSFVNYGNLQRLYLNDNTIKNNSIHRDVFLPLKYLKILDLALIRYTDTFNITWPKSLKRLTISRNRNQYHISLLDLPDLEVFNAVNCSLITFPQFNESAPIKEVDVSRNPLNSFTVKDIASLCQLGYLGLQWTQQSTLNSTEQWCECLKIQTWINQHRITSSNLNCTKPDPNNESCDLSFSEEMSKFDSCLEKSIKTGQIIRVAFIALIPIVIIFSIWYIYK